MLLLNKLEVFHIVTAIEIIRVIILHNRFVIVLHKYSLLVKLIAIMLEQLPTLYKKAHLENVFLYPFPYLNNLF